MAEKKKKLPFYNDKPFQFNWDRPVKAHPIFYSFLKPIAKQLLNLRFADMKFFDSENIPDQGGFILCANHTNGFDPIAVTYGFGLRRQMYFMAKEEFYHTFYTRWALNIFGGFPVSRGTADRDSIKYCQKIIENGHGLCIFPQGTRDLEGSRPSGFKPGAALVARECQAPVVPVSIRRYKKKSDDKKYSLIIRYGKPIPYSGLGFSAGTRKSRELRVAAKLIEDRVAELGDKDEGIL